MVSHLGPLCYTLPISQGLTGHDVRYSPGNTQRQNIQLLNNITMSRSLCKEGE